jgi:hypothetical protein
VSEAGEGPDPYEVDPFGSDSTPNSLAFAILAASQAEDHVRDAAAMIEHQLALHDEYDNAVAKSARKSALTQLRELRALNSTVQQLLDTARQEVIESGDPNICPSAGSVVDALGPVVGAYDELAATAQAIGTPDVAPAASALAPPPTIDAPMRASQAIHADLAAWVKSRRGTASGDLVVAKATAGVGKTHAMIATAITEQLAGQRVAFAVRTKDQLTGDHPELVERLVKRNPLGKLALAVITGRGEDNCREWKTVEAVMKQGYSPGQAVCLKCDYYPSNATVYGWAPCDYYAERIRAHNLAQGARVGAHAHYPLVVTTHTSVIAAHSTQGGRWGSFWLADVIFFDEDCTDAIEIDVVLDRQQCGFRSITRNNQHANAAAILLSKAMEIAEVERAEVKANSYKKPGSSQLNSHPVHNHHDSHYVGDELHDVLHRAAVACQRTVGLPELSRVLRDVADSQGFHVGPGDLLSVKSTADINALDVPPKALSDVAAAIHSEMSHAMQLRRIVYKRIRGRAPLQKSGAEILAELHEHTDVDPLSYTCRLECLPADAAKGRKKDEWRFVVREFNPLQNHKSRIVVGDAYAQKEHYEQLFHRDADIIDRVSSLHADTNIYRLHHDQCSIGQLRRGGLVDVLSVIENRMREVVRPGDRVLIYGHQVLRSKIEAWAEDALAQLRVKQWEYEHWWGGRGKDQYNGWEHTFCISDPVLSLSGIQHVANARAFRDSTKSKTDDEKLAHGRRVEIADPGRAANSTLHALASSHPRIVLEHERMNVAELTQAIHRGRPVHNPTNIVIAGCMELSPEVLAQTTSVVESDTHTQGRTGGLLIEPARDHEGFPMVHAFVTAAECLKAIRSIINHYGVFSNWFIHALLAPPPDRSRLFSEATSAVSPEVTKSRVKTGQAKTGRPLSGIMNSRDPNYITSERLVSPLHPPGLPSVPESPQASGGADHASLKRRPPMTVVERVWLPPLKWSVAKVVAPRPVRAAVDELTRLDALARMPAPLPGWYGRRRGRPSPLYYDPALLNGSFHAGAAQQAYLAIVENQYGPERDGRLVRPKFDVVVPQVGLSEVPF